MSQSLTGFFTDRPNDFLTIRRGMDALERELKRDSAYLPPQALEIRSRVTELLGLSETRARRGRNPVRNLQDTTPATGSILMSVKATAGVLQKSEQMVRRDCVTGRLAAVKDGRTWLITADSVERVRKGAA